MIEKELILEESKAVAQQVIGYRRHIHKNPELSFEEHRTAEFIESMLDEQGISHRRIAGTGILARIEGGGDLKNAVVLRADIDALPINEENEDSFCSSSAGVMHACGHDMHTSVLLGALTIINRNREKVSGTIFGLFQPGEELCPGGASLVLAEKPFEGYDIRAVVGEHVDPDLATGTFGFRAGQYMASSDEIRITVHGEGGHAAMPHKLKDPVVASADIVMALQHVVSRNSDPMIPTVISVGKVIANGATNIIPDEVYMEGTLRTFDEKWRAEAKNRIRTVARSTAEAYGVRAEVVINDGFPSVFNDPHLTEAARGLMTGMFGEKAILSLGLRSTAEDFGFYTEVYPSLFYRFGVGGTQEDLAGAKAGKLHSSVFNPDERALEFAVAGFVNLAVNLVQG